MFVLSLSLTKDMYFSLNVRNTLHYKPQASEILGPARTSDYLDFKKSNFWINHNLVFYLALIE